jgi:hypothetical protein
MTAYIGEYRDENGKKVFSISFDPPISLEKGCTQQERNAIDEFNKIMDKIKERENNNE